MPLFVFIHGCNKIPPKLLFISESLEAAKAKLEKWVDNAQRFSEFAEFDTTGYIDSDDEEESEEAENDDEQAQEDDVTELDEEFKDAYMLHYELDADVWNKLMKKAGGWTHTCHYYLTIFNDIDVSVYDADISKMETELADFYG